MGKVYILEALHSEDGSAGYNDRVKPGDQLQKLNESNQDRVGEVRVSDYRKFEKNGKYKIFRIKDEKQRKTFVEAAYFFVNSKYVGYSQPHRLTLYNKVKSMGYANYENLNKNVEADCSSLMFTCAQIAGIKNWKDWVTSEMMTKLSTVPELEELTDKKYFESSDYLIPGDVLVKNGHTGCTYGYGDKVDPDIKPEPTPTPEPEPTPSGKVVPASTKDSSLAGKYKVVTDLNLRYGPDSTKYGVIRVLKAGERIINYGYCNKQKTWLLIQDKYGNEGWSSRAYLSKIT